MPRPFRSAPLRTPRRASHARVAGADAGHERLGGLGLWRVHLLGRHGEQTARALRWRRAEGRRGWHAALQAAADDSRHDPEVLRITDEIHAAAHRLTDDEAVCAYACDARRRTRGPLGREFLNAMLVAVAEYPHGDDATGPAAR